MYLIKRWFISTEEKLKELKKLNIDEETMIYQILDEKFCRSVILTTRKQETLTVFNY